MFCEDVSMFCAFYATVSLAIDECADSNGGCQHFCVRNPVGHHCECSHGYMLGFDHKSCIGIVLFLTLLAIGKVICTFFVNKSVSCILPIIIAEAIASMLTFHVQQHASSFVQ